jgi:hypothetical protein
MLFFSSSINLNCNKYRAYLDALIEMNALLLFQIKYHEIDRSKGAILLQVMKGNKKIGLIRLSKTNSKSTQAIKI